MTFSKVSPAHEYPVRPIDKPVKEKDRIDPPGAHHPDDPDIRRVLKPGHACRVCCRITAPVTEKAKYFRFIRHNLSSHLTSMPALDDLTI
jgi:hypothetical protein